VAERGGQVVGFAFAGPADHPDAAKGLAPTRDLHLYSLYLLVTEQRSGTGTSLLEAVLADRPAQLWVLNSNDKARAFYEHHGFQDDGSEFADPDIDGLVEVRMVR
jgi:ribosomal protein S18 acetylase RimI-like enzyme